MSEASIEEGPLWRCVRVWKALPRSRFDRAQDLVEIWTAVWCFWVAHDLLVLGGLVLGPGSLFLRRRVSGQDLSHGYAAL